MDETSWPSEWIRTALSMCVLAVIEDLRETYGYEIASKLAERGLGQVGGGTLYPVLKRLEQEQFVASRWVDGQGGPGRKLYQLTEQGVQFLLETRGNWRQFVMNVNSVIEEGA